jgi:hypothetical protein
MSGNPFRGDFPGRGQGCGRGRGRRGHGGMSGPPGMRPGCPYGNDHEAIMGDILASMRGRVPGMASRMPPSMLDGMHPGMMGGMHPGMMGGMHPGMIDGYEDYDGNCSEGEHSDGEDYGPPPFMCGRGFPRGPGGYCGSMGGMGGMGGYGRHF